ncbi:uncharacterized protein LOC143255803 isoform X2 [Tachypleus tridentatus]|uniref:uncharacterized protein LOC143255803 isoform X2 n=1 Tax=Tachypleus tridentatus TaxID=6853 RepID=UPI003FD18180
MAFPPVTLVLLLCAAYFNSKPDKVWINVQKKAEIYQWLPTPRSDKYDNRYGISSSSWTFFEDEANWDDEREPVYDCVALRVHNRTMLTYRCHKNTKLPFVCVSQTFWDVEKLYDTPFCRDDEKFSFLINGCLKIENEFKKSFYDATDSCSKLKGRMITKRLYLELINASNFTDGDFWLQSSEGINGLCTVYMGHKKRTLYEECTLNHGYICISSALKTNVKVFIQPDHETYHLEMASFLLNESSKKYLRCGITYNNYTITYVWMKNGLYIEYSSMAILPTSVVDYTKWIGNIKTRQGEYMCGIWFPGFPKPVMSSPASVYFSDFISFVMKIQGKNIPFKGLQKLQFYENTRQFVTKKMESLIEKLQNNTQKPDWDFMNFKRNPDSSDIVLRMHIFLKVTETSRSHKAQEALLKYIESRASEVFNATVQVKFTDFCGKQVEPVKGENVTWNETHHTKFAVSNPYCLNESWQLVIRACESSFVDGSRWSDFNSSQCVRLQHYINEEIDDPPCRLEYKYKNISGSLFCMRKVQDALTWSEAQSECQKDFAYLLTPDMFDSLLQLSDQKQKNDELKKVFGKFNTFWIGIQNISNVLHYLGFHPKPLNLTTEKLSGRWEVYGSSFDKKCFAQNTDLKIASYYCEEKLPFICVHKPLDYELKSLPVCPSKWVTSFLRETCFFVDESWRKATWYEAQQNCNGGRLLTLADLLKYKIFLKYLKEKSFTKRKNSKEFWMGLTWKDKTYKWEDEKNSSVTYVHWKSTTDFSETAGVLSLNFGKEKSEGNWDLADPKLTKCYICERQADRQATAWAEVLVLNHSLSLLSGNISTQIPFLKCETENSLPNSIVWYFDEIVVKGHRYSFIDNSDPKLTFKEVLSGHPLWKQEDNILRAQGYYECETEQMRPFHTVKSFKQLFRVDGIWALAASFIYVKDNTDDNPHNMNVKDYWDRLKYTENHLKRHFANILGVYEFEIHVRNLSLNMNYTKVIFNMYSQQITNISKETAEEEEIRLLNIKHLWQNSIGNTNFKIINDSIVVRSTLSCFQNVTFDTVSRTNMTWPHTQLGATVIPKEFCIEENGDPVVRKCEGDFNVGAFWGPVKGSCRGTASKVTLALNELSQVEVRSDNTLNVSSNMRKLIEDNDIFYALDVYYVAKIMKKLSLINTTNDTVLHDVAHVVDKLLEIEESILASSQRKINATSMITNAVEKMLSRTQSNVLLSLKQVAVSRNVNHQFQAVKDIQVGIQLFSVSSIRSKTSLQPVKYKDEFPASDVTVGIDVTPAIIEDHKLSEKVGTSVALEFIIYKNGKLFSSSSSTIRNIVVGPVIGGNIEAGPIYDLDIPIEIVFNLPEKFNTVDEKKLQCMFWDQRLSNNEGSWSSKGCQLGEKKNNRFTCLCDHLTHFGMIFLESVDPDSFIEEKHEAALKTITYFGCSLSIFGLALTILTFIVFRKWRKGIGHQTLCNLAVALLGSLVIFLIDINKKHGPGLCMLSAALLHYFLMVSFGWMLVEAVLQYLRFVKVVGTYIPRFMCKAMICAWGTPLLIVCLVLSIDHKQYYYGKNICWLAPYGFYIAFLAPVGIVVVVSLVVFNTVIYSIFCGQQIGLRTNQSEKKIAIAKLRAALCILILLGATWVFGFLSVMSKSRKAILVFQYLFTFTTTIQGFFIFFFHVFQEKSARELWNHLLRRKSHTSTTSTNTFNLSRTDNRYKLNVTNNSSYD